MAFERVAGGGRGHKAHAIAAWHPLASPRLGAPKNMMPGLSCPRLHSQTAQCSDRALGAEQRRSSVDSVSEQQNRTRIRSTERRSGTGTHRRQPRATRFCNRASGFRIGPTSYITSPQSGVHLAFSCKWSLHRKPRLARRFRAMEWARRTAAADRHGSGFSANELPSRSGRSRHCGNEPRAETAAADARPPDHRVSSRHALAARLTLSDAFVIRR